MSDSDLVKAVRQAVETGQITHADADDLLRAGDEELGSVLEELGSVLEEIELAPTIVGYSMVQKPPSYEGEFHLIETAMTSDGQAWYREHSGAFFSGNLWNVGAPVPL